MIPNIAVAKLHQSHSEDEQKTKMSRKTGEKTDMASQPNRTVDTNENKRAVASAYGGDYGGRKRDAATAVNR